MGSRPADQLPHGWGPLYAGLASPVQRGLISLTKATATLAVWVSIQIALSGAACSPSTPSLSDQVIGFLRAGDIWTIHGDRTGVHRWTTDCQVRSFEFSPDSNSIVYCRGGGWDDAAEVGQDGTMARISIGSGKVQELTQGNNPRITPDGQWLAFDRFRGNGKRTDHGNRLVYLMQLDGGAPEQAILNPESFDRWFGPEVMGWDREGKTVLVSGTNETGASNMVYAVSVGSRQLEPISNGYYPLAVPQNTIVLTVHTYYHGGGSCEYLYRVGLPGSAPVPASRLTDWDLLEQGAAVSPTGSLLAFCAYDSGGSATDAAGNFYKGEQMAVVYDLANGTRRPILTSKLGDQAGGSQYESVAWSPDEQRLCLQTWTPNGGRRSLWILGADGTGLHKLVDDGQSAAWRPKRP